jgi:hypothetical protein
MAQKYLQTQGAVMLPLQGGGGWHNDPLVSISTSSMNDDDRHFNIIVVWLG